jgi:hypothetical protein
MSLIGLIGLPSVTAETHGSGGIGDAAIRSLTARTVQLRIQGVPEPLRNSASISSATAGARERKSSTIRY